MNLFLATGNQGKVKEYESAFAADSALSKVQLMTLADLSKKVQLQYSPEETGLTFIENSYIKAKALFRLTREPVIAEDAGLVVDALAGRPGVHSARYAPTDEERNTKLLSEMENKSNRSARFIAVICFLEREKMPVYFIGRVEGRIAMKPSGSNGFGYDPVFIPEGGAKTFAQMSISEKKELSHRGKAISLLASFLRRQVY